MDFITLGIGLILVSLANVVLGTARAYMNGKFDKKKLVKGLVKAVSIMFAFGLLALAGNLNPSVIGIVLGDTTLSLYAGVKLVLASGFTVYGTLTLQHLIKLLGLNKTKKG